MTEFCIVQMPLNFTQRINVHTKWFYRNFLRVSCSLSDAMAEFAKHIKDNALLVAL